MPEPAEQPTAAKPRSESDCALLQGKPPRTWRPMVGWTLGILAALGLAWFVGAVVVPYFQARAAAQTEDFASLGSPGQAARKLTAYLQFSRFFAGERTRRLEVIYILGGAGPEVSGEEMVPVLAAALKERDAEVRTAAAGTLRMVGAKARKAIPAMATALQDSCKEVRFEVAHGLAEMGPEVPEALPPLARAIGASDPAVSWCASEAFCSIGPKARAATPILMEQLRDSNPVVRAATLRALYFIGPAAAEAIPEIEPLLKDKDPDVRAAAASALKMIRSEEPPK